MRFVTKSILTAVLSLVSAAAVAVTNMSDGVAPNANTTDQAGMQTQPGQSNQYPNDTTNNNYNNNATGYQNNSEIKPAPSASQGTYGY